MKKILVLFVLLGFLNVKQSFGQTSTVLTLNEDNTYSYEHVFEKSGLTQTQIFDAIKAWVVKNIKTQSNTNYFDESTKGTITTNPAFAGDYGNWIDFKMIVDIKDGKYRLTANSFIWHQNPAVSRPLGDYSGLGLFKKAKVKILEKFDEQFKIMLNEIEKSSSVKSDW